MKKTILSIVVALIVLAIPVGIVIAGLTQDFGTLATNPPAGSANYTTWLGTTFPPAEIMTEDNFNTALGLDTGYTNDGWIMQVRNFNSPSEYDGVPVTLSFGGLGSYRGSHWYYQFNWEGGPTDPTATDHGDVPLTTAYGPDCPTIDSVVPALGTTTKTYTVTFYGQPNMTYYVYRSTSPSGAGNGESNGRYINPLPVTTDATGKGVLVDTRAIPLAITAWYTVIYLDNTGAGQHGCHSEPIRPTAVEVTDFSAVYDPEVGAVKFSWQTFSENNLVGFKIYRSESETGARIPVNETLIPAINPGSIDGAFYDTTKAPISLWDTEVVKGPAYYYWLEVIKTEGSPSILSTVMFPVKDNFIFVPLINR